MGEPASQTVERQPVNRTAQLAAAQALWGEGNLFPAEPRFAVELASALKLKKDKDIAIFGSGLCGGARELAGHLNARISCYEWDAALSAMAKCQNVKSSAGFLLHSHQIEPSHGFPAGKQYDCVFILMRLHQRPDRSKLLKQMAGALKPGGTAVLANYVSGAEPLTQDLRQQLFSDAAPGPFMRAPDLHFALGSAGLEVGIEFDVTQKFRDAIVAGFGRMKDVVLSIMRQQSVAGEELGHDVKLWAARHDQMKAGRLEVRCTFAMKPEARAGA